MTIPERCTTDGGQPAAIDEHVDEVCGEGFYHLEMLDDDSAYLQLGERVFSIVGGGLFVVYRELRPASDAPAPPREDSVLVGHHIDCAFVRAWLRSEEAVCNCAEVRAALRADG